MVPYKILAAIVGVTASIGGGILITRSLTFKEKPSPVKSTVRERLQRAGYSLNVSDNNWSTIFQEHNKDGNSANIKFIVSNWQDLKARCDEYLNSEDKDSKYEISKKWCVEPRKISAFLAASNLTSLKTDGEDESNTDKDKWKKW